MESEFSVTTTADNAMVGLSKPEDDLGGVALFLCSHVETYEDCGPAAGRYFHVVSPRVSMSPLSSGKTGVVVRVGRIPSAEYGLDRLMLPVHLRRDDKRAYFRAGEFPRILEADRFGTVTQQLA